MRLVVLCPTRGRPANALRLLSAVLMSSVAEIVFLVDDDDPERDGYRSLAEDGAWLITSSTWSPMCEKLNRAAVEVAASADVVGFMGDDHLPRTDRWDARVLEALGPLQVVYCNDGFQGETLPTSVFMDAEIIRRLGWMVPPGIAHLYCDNAWRDLGLALGTLRYLPDVLIEHLHPHAGKADTDEQYERVNSALQYDHDRAAYEQWREGSLPADVARLVA